MKCNRLVILAALIAVVIFNSPLVFAGDLRITGNISGTQNYDSPEGIVLDKAVIAPGARVTAVSTYEVRFRAGTRVKDGARLTVQLKDNDGLSNRCEMTYFGDLTHDADADDDADGLTNAYECILGFNPNENNPDNDADGLPDAWEVQYFGLSLADENAGHDADFDGDGISNWIEYCLKTDPSVIDPNGPGLHYQYDKLGRIIRIDRIPSR
jgi:hypothetical protein